MGEVEINLGVRMVMSVWDSGVCFKAGSRVVCWVFIFRRVCCRMERMASSEFSLLDDDEGWVGFVVGVKIEVKWWRVVFSAGSKFFLFYLF